MSGTEEIIKRILALRPQLKKEAVVSLIEEERAKTAGLLTEEAAAHLVASNLGLDGAGERIEAKLMIGDLTAGLSDVTISGRVIYVFPARSFTRRDGREGKVLRMLLGDRTGKVNVVFWDEKADHVSASKVKQGKIVMVLHGYTRERRDEIELNVGNRGQIFFEPLGKVDEDYPPIESFFKTPKEVQGTGSINIQGVVVDKYPVSTFTRSDGGVGKVSRLILEEGGGRVNLVLWDERVDEVEDVGLGTRLRIISGSIRERDARGAEVHSNWSTAIEVIESGVEPNEPVSEWTKLADLKAGMRSVNVAARVAQIGGVREFTHRDGSAGKVASVLLQDESGIVRLNLWNNEADLLNELQIGVIVTVENGYTRMGLGTLGLNVGQYGRLTIAPENIEVAALNRDQHITEIRDLKEGTNNITVRGQILESPEIRDVETARGSTRVASFRIEDETGQVRVSLWRDLIKEVEGLTPGTTIRVENCNVRPPFDGLLQLSSNLFTKIFEEGIPRKKAL